MSFNNSGAGWAIRRNGSCLYGESDCGTTPSDFHVCCPSGAFCPMGQAYNTYCCDQQTYNCSSAIETEGPFCGNSTWDMYDNNGKFCCDSGLAGFRVNSNGNSGCADAGHEPQSSETYLALVDQQEKATNSSSDSLGLPEAAPSGTDGSSSSSTLSADPLSSGTESDTSSNTVAIIAGAVGGAVVLALIILAVLYMMRRKRRRSQKAMARKEADSREFGYTDSKAPIQPLEMDGWARQTELDGGWVGSVAELPGSEVPSRVSKSRAELVG